MFILWHLNTRSSAVTEKLHGASCQWIFR